MDLAQLANLGEFIGGAAVLVTLVYLSIQLRQANQNTRVEGNQQLGRDYQRHQAVMMDDQHLDAFMKGLRSYGDLGAAERFKFDACVVGLINLVEATLYHNQAGRLDDELRMQERYLGPRLFAYPGLREWWAQNERAAFAESTSAWVDRQIEANRDQALFWHTEPRAQGSSAEAGPARSERSPEAP